jgi:hypothetical protein
MFPGLSDTILVDPEVLQCRSHLFSIHKVQGRARVDPGGLAYIDARRAPAHHVRPRADEAIDPKEDSKENANVLDEGGPNFDRRGRKETTNRASR